MYVYRLFRAWNVPFLLLSRWVDSVFGGSDYGGSWNFTAETLNWRA